MSPRLAILGGGQLAQMLARAAQRLGVTCRALDPNPDACARHACELIVGPYDDPAAIAALTRGADALTFEFENVPPRALEIAADLGVRVAPNAHSLRTASDRLLEKQALSRLGIPVPPYAQVHDAASLQTALGEVPLPALLKRRTGGYDGKGQARVDQPHDAPHAWDQIARAPALLEARVPLRREVSALVCRGHDGAAAAYPIVENRHEHGILVRSSVPALIEPAQARLAAEWAARLAEHLGYVGVLALELFVIDPAAAPAWGELSASGLLANEIAPRVHNTGHWSIEGARTSQFENHVRAVLGLPLGPAEATAPAVMLNLLGAIPRPDPTLGLPNAVLHDYGKAPQPGRKLGHITITGPNAAATAHDLAARLSAP